MSDTVELHYQADGPEDTRPLVILHGLFGSADNWRSHAKQWQRRRRVVAVDLRNHGRSPHVAGMSYAAMADDVIALLDRLQITDCDLLGHSMGGKVAMSVARLAPRRVASLIVADIAPIAYEHGHDSIFAAMRRVERSRPASRQEADALMAEEIDSSATRLFLATNLVREDGVMRWRVGLDEIAADYDAIIDVPAGDSPYEGPALEIRGAQSPYVPDSTLPALRAILPNVEIVTLEAGHWVHAEVPKPFREAVDAFLEAGESH
ncbi:alpha/beta fold hydrolase [Modicisalibacter sp. 'Wilcox']|uniref:alpha/beta fold hydrolase n=1 Tax=Modicisalibacter sp. 'Wilcox' TaxID=2679914 RepID=UPI0013D1233F|nr:alpha/beta fold hydrolase [Modicisalibacter sp. 'Wilcox']